MDIKAILGRLNEEQLRDALSLYGIRRTIAGPGTGKTGTQVAQIANFIANGLQPSSILAITFTNKAASETRHRVVKNVGELGWQVAASTYHSFCRKWILKPNEQHDFFKELGYNSGLIIFDEADSTNAMREVKGRLDAGRALIWDACGASERSLLKDISAYRAEGISVAARKTMLKQQSSTLIPEYMSIVNRYPKGQLDKKLPSYDVFLEEVRNELIQNPALYDVFVSDMWSQYATECSSNSGIDFDDQILYSKLLLERDPSIAKRLSKRFTHICLDEFQDVNACQWSVIQQIISHVASPNLFIIGDDRQSIYMFRNAKVELMMGFDKLYPTCVTNTFIKNYRSTEQIIGLGNAHAITMENQIGRGQLESGLRLKGQPVNYSRFSDDKSEARWVVNEIKSMISSGEDPSKIAVLYRGHSLKDQVVDELTKSNLEYSVLGDLDFYETAEVKSAIAILRVIIRDRDVYALSKVLDYATVGITPARLKSKHHEVGGLPMEILKGIIATDKRAANKGTGFYNDLESLIELKKKVVTHKEFLSLALNTPTLLDLYSNNTDAKGKVDQIFLTSRENAIAKLTKGVSDFWTEHLMPNFKKDAEKLVKKKANDDPEKLEEILSKRLKNMEIVLERLTSDLNSDITSNLVDSIDELVMRAENGKSEDISAIQLMTNHASKGLEFDHVFLIGAEQEGYIKEDSTQHDIEEESRNFYVAITRASRTMTITSAANRYMHGSTFSRTELQFLHNIKPLMNCIEHKASSFQINHHQSQSQANYDYYNQSSSVLSNSIQKFGNSQIVNTSVAQQNPNFPSKNESDSLDPDEYEQKWGAMGF
ncbi:ATP-dependent helicase (plasmid) [Shewanella xiamenensis]|uniref:DNA 3'-5' helicase n=1 Tax=Shewanella xiamenensis TaxID=332186 RepID=A0ABT6UDZ3_9GAMM|nr:ATP-dependent helicase [Shewanella xiamenensis]MDI5832606.1 ATP-dependent helicase [Shewanella xiamenensis]WHF57776.1 ATP-dependent helicase [Shewanella xiamenensis]